MEPTVIPPALLAYPGYYLTPEELAILLEVKRRVIYSWVDKGALAAVRHGKLLRVTKVEALRFASVPARTF